MIVFKSWFSYVNMIESIQLTRNKEEDRGLEQSTVTAISAETVLSNIPSNQQKQQPDVSMQHSYRRVSNLFDSFPNLRVAGNTSFALRGEETSGTQKKMNRRNNTNHTHNLRNWVIPKKKLI